VTAPKKKQNKRRKAMLENRKPLDSFLVWVRVLDQFWDQYYLGNPFHVSMKIWNVLEKSVDSVSHKKWSYFDFLYVCGAEEARVKTQKDIIAECLSRGLFLMWCKK
jgi:hypothetical protein